ncbi:MAG TPA: MarR family transcriptional regulator [Solirubrobacterales bacterium]|nr:MarR family transcriptional regulator [Solirubrobacterales bacterium]
MAASGAVKKDSRLAAETWGLLASLVYPPPFLAIAREFDLRPVTFGALRALERPRTMSELAQLLYCDNSNVTAIVDNLEEKTLAVRKPSEDDRRIKVVELSGQGEALLKRLSREVAKPPDWVRALSAEDQEALRDLLRRAVEAPAAANA